MTDEIMKNQKYYGYAKGGRGCDSFLCCVLVWLLTIFKFKFPVKNFLIRMVSE